ncbi:hypothetical protein FI667_g658, partial [Globisporangium splendens]
MVFDQGSAPVLSSVNFKFKRTGVYYKFTRPSSYERSDRGRSACECDDSEQRTSKRSVGGRQVDSESEAKEEDFDSDVSVGVRHPEHKGLVHIHVNSVSEEMGGDMEADISAGLRFSTHKRNVIEISSWSDISDDGPPIRHLRRSNRVQASQSTRGRAVSTQREGDDLYLFPTIDDRQDIADEASVVGIQIEYHVVWFEPNNAFSRTWEPKRSISQSPDSADAIARANRFVGACPQLRPKALTFGDFCKTTGECSGMTADDSGLCVFDSLRIVMELAGIACDAFDTAFEALVKKRRDDK